MKKNLLSIIAWLIAVTALNAQSDSELFKKLKSYPQLEVTKIESLDGYQESFLIMMKQPIDHNHPEAGVFKQRIWLSHIDKKAPVVMVTEGYAAPRNYKTELAEGLKANQLIVEHRYFQESTPENPEWKYLNVKNAAADHHQIVRLFKNLYKGKWLTTGISKGGQTTLFHRALYPRDVDVSVPYVAPVNLQREDARLLDFFKHVGTESDRNKIKAFQHLVLKRKAELLPMFKESCAKRGWKYTMGYEKAYEMAVLEYPFAFWQWGISVDVIPDEDAEADKVLTHLIRGASPDYFTDESMLQLQSFFYQAYKELGYYNYVPGELKQWMTCVKQDTISSSMFAPGGDTLSFNQNTMLDVVQRLKKSNPKMVLVCGEYDPWGATSLDVEGMSKSFKVVKPKGSHKARINNLPDAKKEEVWALIKKWMKVK